VNFLLSGFWRYFFESLIKHVNHIEHDQAVFEVIIFADHLDVICKAHECPIGMEVYTLLLVNANIFFFLREENE
jgi:hypothetical protein